MLLITKETYVEIIAESYDDTFKLGLITSDARKSGKEVEVRDKNTDISIIMEKGEFISYVLSKL